MDKISKLTMLDEFGGRKTIIPAEVKGRFRTWRNRVHGVLLIIFLVLPWTKINGLQTLHFDVPNRRFSVFGQMFLAHDAPLVFFLFAILILVLMLVTALWGRVWCGWACPQTVFVDTVFRRIEIWIEGNYIERRKLQAAPLSAEKILKYGLKWFCFLIISSIIAHSFIAYFSGASELLVMMRSPPGENWNYFLLVSAITGIVLFDFGWFREQFCIIMCPYGRFQGLLMDNNSVTVAYDSQRGEPRKNGGDCVACNRCVQVCPTGIDIRDGLQIECIACTACIDACDEIMTKVKKPTGLIRYKRESRAKRALSPRIISYLALLVFCAAGFFYNLAQRAPYSVVILRAKGEPYRRIDNDRVLNHYKVHVLNQSLSDQRFTFALDGSSADVGAELTTADQFHLVPSGTSKEIHLFVKFPIKSLNANGQSRIPLKLVEHIGSTVQSHSITIVGPMGATN